MSGISGKTFYRNAAQTNRKGIDAEFKIALSPTLNLSVNYSYSDFKFTKYLIGSSDLTGNKQPLIPLHKFNTGISFPVSSYVSAEGTIAYNGVMWLDDVNFTKSKAYVDANIVFGTTSKYSKKITLGLQVNNIFNSLVYSNFRANAAAGRYYEAASQRNIGCFVQYHID
ncbi:MAG: TonB-dependent receptor [Saprospiraceae bacterium]|nr:TonB-dependent receptor [Saprospiraceae bacterium]